jgi:choline dehydrogenase-like flavoprotein
LDPSARRLPADYPVNTDASPISVSMYNAVGGSTVQWSAHFPRLHPSDFRVKSLDGVADDWPLTYSDLEPYYDLNDRINGVAGLDGDPAYPDKSPRQTPPVLLGALGNTVARGFDRLGWHWWPADSAILTRPYDGRDACNNCGPCNLGCPSRARASADVTYWPRAISAGVRLVTGARVSKVLTNGDRATGVEYFDSHGREQTARAPVVVLACNGIGTPRLLLNSANAGHPNGLANSSGQVGRNLMFHPYATVTGVFDDVLDGHTGPVGCSIVSQQFYETDPDRDFVRGYILQLGRSGAPLHTAMGGAGDHMVPWGDTHHQVFAERHRKTGTIAVIGEDLPEPHNRVDLDPELTDDSGITAPRVHYALSDNSRALMAHGVDNAVRALNAAGATETITTNPFPYSGWHLMGTARMGTDPGNSVVDPWGRAHDVDNLYVIDGSIFVTAGGVNPTSTMQALALRIADRIADTASDIG